MNPEFRISFVNADGLNTLLALQDIFDDTLAQIDACIEPDPVRGRLRAIIVTKLQEAFLFACHAAATVPALRHEITADEAMAAALAYEAGEP